MKNKEKTLIFKVMRKVVLGLVAALGLAFTTQAQTESADKISGQVIDYNPETHLGLLDKRDGSPIIEWTNSTMVIVVPGDVVTIKIETVEIIAGYSDNMLKAKSVEIAHEGLKMQG